MLPVHLHLSLSLGLFTSSLPTVGCFGLSVGEHAAGTAPSASNPLPMTLEKQRMCHWYSHNPSPTSSWNPIAFCWGSHLSERELRQANSRPLANCSRWTHLYLANKEPLMKLAQWHNEDYRLRTQSIWDVLHTITISTHKSLASQQDLIIKYGRASQLSWD